ncbi:MAG TPA: hypothetical protein VK762_19600 [Polyangiaceae bacterium]|nr:hypothetical protein [Polyangiaceae bacterium]
MPCPHPWLGITTPLSPPDDVVPELLPALASSPAGPPLLELVLAVPPEDDDPLPPLEEGPLEDPGVPDDDPPPELVPVAGFPLPSAPPPVVGLAELHPATPSESAAADAKVNTESMALRFMTTPRVSEITDCRLLHLRFLAGGRH